MKTDKKNKRLYDDNRADILAMLLPPLIAACYFHGLGVLKPVLVSVAAATVCEYLGAVIMHRRMILADFTSLSTGLIIALMMPASVPLWMPAMASSFAMIVAKLPFGHRNALPFSPAAAGTAFVTVCRPDLMFDFPLLKHAVAGSRMSLAAMLKSSMQINLHSLKFLDVLTGNFPGAMGTGCLIFLLGSFVYMCIRRPNGVPVVFGCLAGAAAAAAALPRVSSVGASVVLELSAGSLVFSALFLMTETGPMPKKLSHRLLYGFLGGAMCILMRSFSSYEDCCCFAVLLLSGLWPAVEPLIPSRKNKKAKEAEA